MLLSAIASMDLVFVDESLRIVLHFALVLLIYKLYISLQLVIFHGNGAWKTLTVAYIPNKLL